MRTYPWPRIIGLTAVAAIAGLITVPWDFPSWGAFIASMVWKAAMVLVIIWGFRRWEPAGPDASTLGFASGTPQRNQLPRLLIGLLGCGLLAVAIGLVFPSAGSGESYGEVHKAGLPLALAELLVRYPTTVLVEEAFFRGWLQPRIAVWAPVTSGILFACFHLQQATTIPSLIPIGIALGLVRWYTGDVRTTAALHYGSNAVFFVSTYM